jgi:hypothetical protein
MQGPEFKLQYCQGQKYYTHGLWYMILENMEKEGVILLQDNWGDFSSTVQVELKSLFLVICECELIWVFVDVMKM